MASSGVGRCIGFDYLDRGRSGGGTHCRASRNVWSCLKMGVGIQVSDLNAWYGKGQALFDINLKVAANHATALIGPSGCGKSTFIRCLNRMHETIPDARVSGRVQIGELDAY